MAVVLSSQKECLLAAVTPLGDVIGKARCVNTCQSSHKLPLASPCHVDKG